MEIKFKKCTEKGNFTGGVVFLLYSNANEFFELRIRWHSGNKIKGGCQIKILWATVTIISNDLVDHMLTRNQKIPVSFFSFVSNLK